MRRKFRCDLLRLWFLILFHTSCNATSWDQWWAYEGISGPDYWGLINPKWILCNQGRHQSPIDIQPDQLLYDPNLRPLEIQGDQVWGHLENTGRGVLYRLLSSSNMDQNGISVPNTLNEVTLSGGPLSYNYTVHHLQLHFGTETNTGGSEHRIAGEQFAGEIQLIAFNSQLYANYSQAELAPNGLAALSLLLLSCDYEHSVANEAITKMLDAVITFSEKGEKQTAQPLSLELSRLVPIHKVRHYITYEGSQTQPPCSENVVWLLANKPLYVANKQLQLLGNMAEHENGLAHNWRPVQPLTKRCVRTNIQFEQDNQKQSRTCTMRSSNKYYVSKRSLNKETRPIANSLN